MTVSFSVMSLPNAETQVWSCILPLKMPRDLYPNVLPGTHKVWHQVSTFILSKGDRWPIAIGRFCDFLVLGRPSWWNLCHKLSKTKHNKTTGIVMGYSVYVYLNPLAPGRWDCKLKSIIVKRIIQNRILRYLCEIALRWISQYVIEDQSTLVQVMT